MAVTAIAVECVDPDAISASPAARIPPACKIFPVASGSRAKIRRLGAAAAFTEPLFMPGLVGCTVPVHSTRLNKRAQMDHRAELPATVIAGAVDFNWSSEVNTLCQRTWSFFVSIGSERSE